MGGEAETACVRNGHMIQRKEKDMKKFVAFLLTLAMMLSLCVPAFAADAPVEESGVDTWVLEKTETKDGFTYFVAEIPCVIWYTDELARNGQREVIPALAYFQTAVNKAQGKIALTISITVSQGRIKEAVCPAAIVRGDMGSADLVDLSARNLIAVPTIYINDMFEGLERNVATGEVRVLVSQGTFSGPNGLQGYYAGGRSTIDLSEF